ARRLVAQKCIYGVDKNPLAVALARLSMWLVTCAKEHPFTFVDHALQCGDSLVGLSKEQIANLTPYPLPLKEERGEDGGEEKKKATRRKKEAEKAMEVRLDLVRPLVAEAVARADVLRKQIHAIGDPPNNAELRRLWMATNDALARVRLLGDAVLACYFTHDTDKGRKAALKILCSHVQNWLSSPPPSARLGEEGWGGEVCSLAATLRESSRPLQPFHWEIEFPEVFGRENPGFDCFVGNPPFIGGKKIRTVSGESYRDWLVLANVGSNNNADIAVHFLRQCYSRLRSHGTAGLVGTNTISQGDSRTAGLTWICKNGGSIYSAWKRLEWPGDAAVVISVVHVARDFTPSVCWLNGQEVQRVTPFLFSSGADSDPERLSANVGKAFIGCFVRGMGFTFDDTSEEASPLAAMADILEREPQSREVVLPYIGGEEVLSSPSHQARRYIIHFGSAEETDLVRWPSLLKIVEQRVRPARERLSESAANKLHKRFWWRFANSRPDLYAALGTCEHVLAIPRVSQHLSVAILPARMVFSDQLVVIPYERWHLFGVIQSEVHEVWARFFASTLGDGLRYNPTDCFETFPFPPCLYPLGSPPPSPTLDALEAIGKDYYEYRAALMADEAVRAKLMNGEPLEGLTKTYNRFHDPKCHLPGIVRLRELHAQMDRAVLDAYGWQDIKPEYDFRKHLDESIRLRWSEETRDEVLARLLELNRGMSEGETSPPSPLSRAGRGGG
ncbi:MAG: hypothetical protein RMJ98_21635, partial [Myxococcales bacterium]|nr:hypothetical protein [Polyangiaceae bacterium]MDW8251906.1 hypothetical protein [Myxococcales bacterium]